MAELETDTTYDSYYFRHYAGGAYQRTPRWLQFFNHIAEHIVRGIDPRTVLDAGCAMGFLVEALRNRGVEAFGIDISDYAIGQVAADIRPYCKSASILEPLPRRYDLILSIEVIEHLSGPDGSIAIRNLCQATDDILFSSTPSGYRETTHLNVQPVDYWAGLFAAEGFVRDIDFDASFIAPWAARFRRQHGPIYQVLRGYERKFWSLAHENHELRSLSLELQSRMATSERVVDALAGRTLDREQQVWALHGYIEVKDRYIESLLAHVAAKDELLGDLNTLIRARDADLESLRARVACGEHSIAELEGHIRARDSHIESLLARAAVHEQAIAEGEMTARSLRDRLGRIERSRAWRVAVWLKRLSEHLFPPQSGRRRAVVRALQTARRANQPGPESPVHRGVPPTEQRPAANGVQPDATDDPQAADRFQRSAQTTIESDAIPDTADETLVVATPVLPETPRPDAAPRVSGRVLIVNGSMGDMERYRCHHAREQLALAGMACEICNLTDPRLLGLVPHATVLILHRMQWGPLVNEVVAVARAAGDVTVLYDIDDLIFRSELEGHIQALQLGTPLEQAIFRVAIRRFRQTLEACDGVLGASETIAQAARELRKPAWVHRNALSQEVIDLSETARHRRHPNSKVVIGYASGTPTHNRDFADAESALEQILRAYPSTELRIIGPLALDARWDEWSERITRVPFLPWRELPEALAQFDINIAPLEVGNIFCAAKSELKYFEAAAVGVPTVASRWGSFAEAIRTGENGYLAGSPREWFEALEQLVADPPARRRMGERARLDALERYAPVARAASLMNILTEAAAVSARVRVEAQNRGTKFPEHQLAHQFLDGLKGLEIGAAAHNPFGLQTRNIAPPDDYEFYAGESRTAMGMDPARVDVFAYADDLPFEAESQGFVLSSHVVEHLPNLVKAFTEWDRVVRDNGYVFMIVPLKGALPADTSRELTSLEHFIADYHDGMTIDTHPVDGVPGGRMGHYHTLTPDTVETLVGWMNASKLCQWELVAREEVDSKVGNGFTLVYRVRHQHGEG